ncbi:MAG: glycosyltransferase family 1 protein [Candidatus Daviesbacteria bacterium]|nr:glycosyltransferase family 1 protein [Candidatus Daviesbacteria bacterium]
MVIGFDGSRAFQKDRTGTENYSYQLLKALAKIDKKNKYIVYLRSCTVTPGSPSVTLIRRLAEKGIITPAIYPSANHLRMTREKTRNDKKDWPANFQFKKIKWLRLWTQGGLAAQTFKDKLDVLFVPAHTLPIVRRPGLKTVVTVHDLGSQYLPSMHQLKQRLYLSYMQKFQLKTATKIIAVSKATKQDLIQRVGIKPDKISVVYEGYDRKLFYNKKNLFKSFKSDLVVNSLRWYGLKPGSYFLFVGTVQPRKNLERLIRAFSVILNPPLAGEGSLANASTTETSPEILRFAQNDNFKLAIAGSKGWLSDEIYKLPKKLGIGERVKFLGYVPDENLPVLYSGAVAFTFPSLFEGFGLPILEAQASGCPVLTSNVSSMPEVGGKGAIYVDPYSIDDIVKGIRKLQRVPEGEGYRSQLIKQGFENVKRFSWEKCAWETLEVLLSS